MFFLKREIIDNANMKNLKQYDCFEVLNELQLHCRGLIQNKWVSQLRCSREVWGVTMVRFVQGGGERSHEQMAGVWAISRIWSHWKYLILEKGYMEQVHELIVIGAGMAGIGASRTLTQRGCPHIILESRDRVGGRIYPNQFAGVEVDIGATFVHCPKKNNPIAQFMQEEQCQSMKALVNSEFYYYEDEGIMNSRKSIDNAEELFDEAIDAADKKCHNGPQDMSLAEAVSDYLSGDLTEENQQAQDIVYWKLNLEANIEGIELNEMSARAYCEEDDHREDDIIPLGGGYPALLQKLYKSCKTNVEFNTRVVAIDMTGPIISLRTQSGKVYQAKRVISSIPLGILQRNLIQFNPPLPQPYQKAISSIGNGFQNKLFASFKEPFWGNRKGWINFVLKGKKHNKYPIAFIYPCPKNNILVIFVAGKASIELGQWSEQQIFKDVDEFLSLFLDDDEYDLEQTKMTSWHLDEHCFGSYSFYKVGTHKEHYQQLRKPIQNRFWFAGEHTNPENFAFAHGAYETGVWSAQEAMQH